MALQLVQVPETQDRKLEYWTRTLTNLCNELQDAAPEFASAIEVELEYAKLLARSRSF